MKPQRISRRRFLDTVTAGAAVAGAPALLRGLAPGGPGPAERIRLGFIGTGKRGSTLLDEFLKEKDVEVTALCDVWQERREGAVKRLGGKPRACRDHRELLEARDVDAVVIATPPHWHALQAIDACEAGKDLYLEKPMTLSVAESAAVVAAVKAHGRISQVGTQIHAGDNYRRVVEYVRSGKLGPIHAVRTYMVMNQGPEGIGIQPDSDPPAGLDWERWCGPAPLRPFNPLIAESAYHNCSFLDYSGGWTPGMAPHILDLAWWALNLEFPRRVAAAGGRYVIRDAGDSPDTHEVLFEFPSLTLTWSMSLVNSYGLDLHGEEGIRRRLGVRFEGVNGTLVSDYQGYQVVPEGERLPDPAPPEKSIPASPGHQREWLDALRSREPPSCHVGYHHRIDVAIALANIALRVRRAVEFDSERLAIPGDAEARALLEPAYRPPWKLPARYCPPRES